MAAGLIDLYRIRIARGPGRPSLPCACPRACRRPCFLGPPHEVEVPSDGEGEARGAARRPDRPGHLETPPGTGIGHAGPVEEAEPGAPAPGRARRGDEDGAAPGGG